MNDYNGLEIAVIGMAGRFPSARNVDEFWRLLQAGREGLTTFSADELREAGVPDALLENPNYIRRYGYLQDNDLFDAELFGYSAHEAVFMDPQFCVFHECAWEALEHAGYHGGAADTLIGIYAGASNNSAWIAGLADDAQARADMFRINTLTGREFLGARVAYALNLKGPVMTVQTACSTSLVAVHLACQGLTNGECDLALAGAVSVQPGKRGYLAEKGMIYSPDGVCRPFDANANGVVGGEGCGIVVLRRLEDALQSGDNILAVIKGSAVTNDGREKVGFTAPGIAGQVQAIRSACQVAGVTTDSVSYIEAHGTATALGDPVEIEALTQAFGAPGSSRRLIGSLKSNIGHLDVAAGVAGLIKTVLSLQQRQLPPSLHFRAPNANIDFDAGGFEVNDRLIEWQGPLPLRAGVSSFGIGGTNAHVIVEEAPKRRGSGRPADLNMLFLSANSRTALDRASAALLDYIDRNPHVPPADICYTLHVGRRALPHRRAFVVADSGELRARLGLATGAEVFVAEAHRARPVCFVFPGQESQYPGMGQDLYESEPLFREEVDRCRAIASSLYDFALPGNSVDSRIDGSPATEFSDAALGQPALFILEYALASLLMKLGCRPAAMIGQGLGEYVAACLSGVFSLKDALALVIMRGRQMSLADFASAVEKITRSPPSIPFVSSLTGKWIDAVEATSSEYWTRHARQPVRCADGMECLSEIRNCVLLEVGPGGSLASLTRQASSTDSPACIAVLQDHPHVSERRSLYSALCRLFASGCSLNWSRFYADAGRQRVALPTYAFESRRYQRTRRPHGGSIQQGRAASIADWFYEPVWQPAPVASVPQPANSWCWVIFEDDHGLGRTLTELLRARGSSVIRVLPGRAFDVLEGEGYRMDVRDRGHYASLAAAIVRHSDRPINVVHLWSVYSSAAGAGFGDRFEQAQARGFNSVAMLVREIGVQSPSRAAHFNLISSDACQLPSRSVTYPEKAGLSGLSRVIAQELPHSTGRSIDIHLSSDGGWMADVDAAQLLDELASANFPAAMAWRKKVGWVQRFVPLHVPAVDAAPAAKKNGVYLITGGLGKIGMVLARELARSCQARLVLVSRRSLPPKSQWPALASDAGNRDSAVLAELMKMEALGARVDVLRSDVSDRNALVDVMDWIDSTHGELHGVIHAAADVHADLLRDIDVDDLSATFAKVHGAAHLLELLDGRNVDFCMLCSSISAVLGGLGFAAYAAANSIVDSLAQDASLRTGVPCLSVNWEGWRFEETFAEVPANSVEKFALLANEGVEACKRLIGLSPVKSQIVVSTGSLHERYKRYIRETRGRQESVPIEAVMHGRPELDTSLVEPTTATETALVDIWKRCLALDRIGTLDNFFELGGDSLLIMQLAGGIRQSLGVELDLKQMFAAPTVKAQAEIIDRLLSGGSTTGLSPIAVCERGSGPLPLSLSQQRLWFIDQLEGAGAAYHLPAAVRLHGELDVPALQSTLDTLVQRHEVLRTVFAVGESEPIQVIAREHRFALQRIDLSQWEAATREAEIQRQARDEASAHFDLSRGPLIRGRLLKVSDREHVLLVTLHHIVSDGWSMGVLIRELGILYSAYKEGRSNPLPELPIQYADYAQWQRQWLVGEVLQGQLNYWQQHLAGAPSLLELPTDRVRPAVQSYRGDSISMRLGTQLSSELKSLARRVDATLYMVLYAGFAIVLSRLSGQRDVVIGTPVANRQRTELEGLIGFFVNTLALRTTVDADANVLDLLQQVKELTLSGYAHQEVPFEQVVEALQPPRSLSHSPVFQVMFAFQNTPRSTLELSGLTLAPQGVGTPTAQFDLSLSMQEVDGEIFGALNYASDLFERASIERWVGYLKAVFAGMARESQQRIGSLPLLGEAERQQVLQGFNATDAAYPQDALIHELFEAQVERTPQAVAVIFEAEELTYAELNRRANQLAHYLRTVGVGPDGRVALCLERSIEMVVGLLGILKAGGAYVPLDPAYPKERLQYMLGDAAPCVVLTQERLKDTLLLIDVPVIAIDSQWPQIADQPDTNLAAKELGLTSRHLAYVIYTSGSTGEPKGVMNEHRGIVNRLHWMQQAYGLGPSDRVLQKTPFGFDVSVWEFFWPLLNGARLIMARPEGHRDPGYLVDLIEARGVTTMHFVPSMLQSFVQHRALARCGSLRQVMCSGEELTVQLQDTFLERLPWVRLHNLYGPTEAAIDVTYWECLPSRAAHRVPIGRPIANTRIHILDDGLQPVPIGVVGEIYIAGVGVARGYLNRRELTAERFVRDPFDTHPDARLYRSGDLARWRNDGAIEYLGRNDHQVKIRGYRIELGEIEARLSRHERVKDAVALVRDDKHGEKRLIAYVTARDVGAIAAEELRAYLAEHLPQYMIPGAFVWLDCLPLTSNGKVDRKALPAPELDAFATREFEAPQGKIETTIATIWQDLLQVEQVGRHDNFFDLGGHSLLAVQLIARIGDALAVDLPLLQLFGAPTLSKLALRVDQQCKRELSDALAVENDPEIEELLAGVTSMSEQEVAALLRQMREGSARC